MYARLDRQPYEDLECRGFACAVPQFDDFVVFHELPVKGNSGARVGAEDHTNCLLNEYSITVCDFRNFVRGNIRGWEYTRTMLIRLVCVLWLTGGMLSMLLAAARDTTVFTAFQGANPELLHFAILGRLDAGMGLDVVVGMGSREVLNGQFMPAVWWGEKQRVGLFLQEQANPGKVYALGSRAGFHDCFARIERIAATDTVISCQGEKSNRGENQKWVYDMRAKRLVKQFSYQPVAMVRALAVEGGAVFIGTDIHRVFAVEYRPARQPPMRLLDGAEAERWTGRFAASDITGYLIRRDQSPVPVQIPFPVTTWEQFADARPARVKNGYTREGSHINDTIGPWQREGERVWFAKNFYDGEGETGVGGFGWFDTRNRSLHSIDASLLADWSVWALNVSPDAVWMALGSNGEYGGMPGGLLRYDRGTGAFLKIPLRDAVAAIVRVGDEVLAGTELGIAVIDGTGARRWCVDVTSDGRRRVAECDPPRN